MNIEAEKEHDQNDSLHSVIEEQKALIDTLRLENQRLQEQIRLLLARRFGRSSEKQRYDHPSLFDEAELEQGKLPEEEEPESIEVPSHQRQKPKRKPLSPDLPRQEVIHDLPEEQKICPHDGLPLKEIGRDISEQLDIVPAKLTVIRHVRIKYACPHCEEGVQTAPMPPQPIPKSMASAGLLAFIAVSKYQDALPLYRQSGIFARHGIELSRTTMASWMIRCGTLVQPLINLMRDRFLECGYGHMDETTVQVIREADRPANSKSYMWVQKTGLAEKPVILFDYDPSRSKEVPVRLLEGFKGVLQTDGYEGYTEACSQPDIVHLGCWAHARRKFSEALKGRSNKGRKNSGGLAGHALKEIQKLYRIEKTIRNKPPDERHTARQLKSRSIIEKLREWLTSVLPKVPPTSLTGKALGYLDRQWNKLIRYLDDGRLHMDNNAVENAIRPFVIGRKNWLFSHSTHGAVASANLYSIIETAKANGVEPYHYLRYVFTELPKAHSAEDFEALLPWNYAQNTLPALP